MKTYTRVCAQVDLDAIKHNMDVMSDRLGDDTKIVAVLKTDGYGHGAIPIAREMEQMDYVWGYGVATLDEGYQLRKEGMEKPILCLECIFPEQMEVMINQNIRMSVSSYEVAKMASEYAVALGKEAILHVKIDTGMSRIGYPATEEGVEDILKLRELPGIVLEGLFTHFSNADSSNKDVTNGQLNAYRWVKTELEKEGLTFPLCHVSNSAGIIDHPEADFDLVRAGIAIYGYYPSDEVKQSNLVLKPSMELIAHIVHVKWIDEGTPVSYGGTYIAPRRTKVATVPVGYGDGYPRSLSNKGYVLIHGQKAPIIGRVCMDKFMVDVTEIDDVVFGDKVVLLGRDGDAYLDIEDIAEASERFSYEFICDLGKRVPREYLKNGEVVEQIDCF